MMDVHGTVDSGSIAPPCKPLPRKFCLLDRYLEPLGTRVRSMGLDS